MFVVMGLSHLGKGQNTSAPKATLGAQNRGGIGALRAIPWVLKMPWRGGEDIFFWRGDGG